jgi:D-sedoheptulose 7-phosphate isomerase
MRLIHHKNKRKSDTCRKTLRLRGGLILIFFPERLYEGMAGCLDAYFDLFRAAGDSVARERMQAAADGIIDVVGRGGAIFSCGNGGSAAIANHLACDWLKGVRTDTTIKPRVSSLSASVELITAIANDIGYDEIFSYQLSSLAKPGDLLITISSSGESPNIVNAVLWAKSNGLRTIAMTGFKGGASAQAADINLHVDAHNYGVVEDIHQLMMHVLAQYVRHSLLVDPKLLSGKKF